MTLSRQEGSSTIRVNQRTRTRMALIRAAAELLREGRPPSMPEAAERALVSLATAYRYFPSADELWQEAAMAEAQFGPLLQDTDAAVDEAGQDPHARLEAAVRCMGWRMLDDQAPHRLMAKTALDRWFAQADTAPEDQVPIREGRRNRASRKVLEPLTHRLEDDDLDRLTAALGIVLGTDSMLALVDGVGLSTDEAKTVMLDAARWLLAGALAELNGTPRVR
jgi:AcrR family transcriptional regulator